MKSDLRVFVVDDDPSVLRALEGMLRSNGFQVEASSPAAALPEPPKSQGIACLLV